jgi:hypothetical protein
MVMFGEIATSDDLREGGQEADSYEEQDGRQRVTSQYWFEPDPLNTVVGKQATCETENSYPAQQRIWKPLLDTGDRLYAEEILFVDTAFGPGFDSKHRRNVFYQRSELD